MSSSSFMLADPMVEKCLLMADGLCGCGWKVDRW